MNVTWVCHVHTAADCLNASYFMGSYLMQHLTESDSCTGIPRSGFLFAYKTPRIWCTPGCLTNCFAYSEEMHSNMIIILMSFEWDFRE